jgi:hypothetical protein
MSGWGRKQALREALTRQAGGVRKATQAASDSSDRAVGPMAGRRARHDGVAMCLLRKDIMHAIPMRREQLIARNRRFLLRLWLCLVLWWIVGWFFF